MHRMYGVKLEGRVIFLLGNRAILNHISALNSLSNCITLPLKPNCRKTQKMSRPSSSAYWFTPAGLGALPLWLIQQGSPSVFIWVLCRAPWLWFTARSESFLSWDPMHGPRILGSKHRIMYWIPIHNALTPCSEPRTISVLSVDIHFALQLHSDLFQPDLFQPATIVFFFFNSVVQTLKGSAVTSLAALSLLRKHLMQKNIKHLMTILMFKLFNLRKILVLLLLWM